MGDETNRDPEQEEHEQKTRLRKLAHYLKGHIHLLGTHSPILAKNLSTFIEPEKIIYETTRSVTTQKTPTLKTNTYSLENILESTQEMIQSIGTRFSQLLKTKLRSMIGDSAPESMIQDSIPHPSHPSILIAVEPDEYLHSRIKQLTQHITPTIGVIKSNNLTLPSTNHLYSAIVPLSIHYDNTNKPSINDHADYSKSNRKGLYSALEQAIIDSIEVDSILTEFPSLLRCLDFTGDIDTETVQDFVRESITLKKRYQTTPFQNSRFEQEHITLMKGVDDIVIRGGLQENIRLFYIYEHLLRQTGHSHFQQRVQMCIDPISDIRLLDRVEKWKKRDIPIKHQILATYSLLIDSPRVAIDQYRHQSVVVPIDIGGKYFRTKISHNTGPDSPLRKEEKIIKFFKKYRDEIYKEKIYKGKKMLGRGIIFPKIQTVHEKYSVIEGDGPYRLFLTYYQGVTALESQLQLANEKNRERLDELRIKIIYEVADFVAFTIYATSKDDSFLERLYSGSTEKEFHALRSRISSKFIGDTSSYIHYKTPFYGGIMEIMNVDEHGFDNYREQLLGLLEPIIHIASFVKPGVFTDRSARNIIIKYNEKNRILFTYMVDFEQLRDANILYDLATATETGLSTNDLYADKKIDPHITTYIGKNLNLKKITRTEDNLLRFVEQVSMILNDLGIAQNHPITRYLPPDYDSALRDYYAIGSIMAMMHFGASAYFYKTQPTRERQKLNAYAMDKCMLTLQTYPLMLAEMQSHDSEKAKLTDLSKMITEFYQQWFLPKIGKDLPGVKK